MITVKKKDIINCIKVINNISSQEMPAINAYKINKLIQAILTEYNKVQQEQSTIVNNCAKRDKNNKIITHDNNIIIQEEKIDEFEQNMNEFLETEVILNVEPLTLDDLNYIKISPASIQLLEAFM